MNTKEILQELDLIEGELDAAAEHINQQAKLVTPSVLTLRSCYRVMSENLLRIGGLKRQLLNSENNTSQSK